MKDRELQKYLHRHPLSHELGDAASPFAVVIPAWQEEEELPGTLASLERAAKFSPQPVDVIVVVNHPEGADPRPSEALLGFLRDARYESFRLRRLYAPDLEYGVGEARKIGMDAVIASRCAEKLESTVLFSLDADSPVEAEYFSRIAPYFPAASGVVIGFRHRSGPETEAGIRRYEEYLARYVRKLREAGSPYAFHTIGSAFAVRGDAYVRAGGMKLRKAGEDFYFLQALAKYAMLMEIPEVLVHPSARLSRRVPFGTGPAVRKLCEGGSLEEIPDPAFDELRELLALLLRDDGALLKQDALPREMLSPTAGAFLEQEGFFRVWPGIRRNTPPRPEALIQAFHTWFDGLKTLRFLHFASRRTRVVFFRGNA